MLKKIRRLFVIKTRFEAYLIIYALGAWRDDARRSIPCSIPALAVIC